MPYDPIPVENLAGGLNLRDQPNLESATFALDLLDVDFDGSSVRSRDGYAQFSAGTGSESYTSLYPYYSATGDRKLLAGKSGGGVRAYNASGVSVTSVSTADPELGRHNYASFGGEVETSVYIAQGNGVELIKYNGTSFVSPITWTGPITPKPYYIAVTPWDSRLIGGGFGGTQIEGNNYSTVRFSEPGDPTNWQDNYVDLTPGDGEGITAIIAWREYVFVFKRTKFFVFYGTSVNSDGSPIFNYRTVNVGLGCLRDPAAGPDGVYFLCDRNAPGIYKTTGADPDKVSGVLDPIFHHSQAAFSVIEPINFSETLSNIQKFRMTVFQNKVLVNAPTGNTDSRSFVYDIKTSAWTVWDLPLRSITPFSISSDQDLMFASDSSAKIYRLSPQYTDDAGTAITWYWQGGWITGGNEFRKQIREWKLWGSGTVTWKVYDNYRTTNQSTDTIAFGNVPVAQKLSRVANRGHSFSPRVEGSGPFRLSKIIGHLREVSIPSKIT